MNLGKIKEMKQGSCTETCLQDIYDSVTFNRDKVNIQHKENIKKIFN